MTTTTIRCRIDPPFEQWLAALDGSILITTYQAGTVALIGHDGARVTFLARQFDKPMGVASDPTRRRLALATRQSVLLLADGQLLAPDYLEAHAGMYDALYLPRAESFTGDLHAHDLARANSERHHE